MRDLKQKVNARWLKFQSFSLICRCFLIATGDSRPGLLINKSVRLKKEMVEAKRNKLRDAVDGAFVFEAAGCF